MDRPHLVNEFDDMGLSISDDIIDECVIICHSNKITASDLVGSWIAYCASSQLDSNDLDKEKLNKLVKSIKTSDEQKIKDKKYIENKSCDVKPNLNDSALQQSVNSPTSIKKTRDTNDSIIGYKIVVSDIDENDTKYENSTVGDIACEFGRGNVDESCKSVQADTLILLKQELWENFIFGQINYQKFENHVQNMVNDIVKNNNLKHITPLLELLSANNDTETSISGTLRVVKKNLCLSSSDGVVKLDLSEAGQPVKPLFMNQVVVVSGTIPDNKVFKVRQLFTNAALPLSKNLPSFSRGNMNLVVAAGPFFSESSPHGTSLKSLIQETIKLEASLLILLGPIFEVDFVLQPNETSTDSFQKCYDDVLETILKPLFSNPSTQNTKLVVLSSWKDAGSYACYPTPPYTESKLPILYPNNVFMVSDPSLFSVNDIIVACNASDSLMGLHVSSINQVHEEMFTKLARQFIEQRSLHPSYTNSPSVPVDQLLWLEHCTIDQNTPHIILMSSQLRTFIRVVEGCLVINVGQLVKHNSQKQAISGTYGKIRISPPTNERWSPETNILAEVIHI